MGNRPERVGEAIRDELSTLGRLGILSVEEQQLSAEWARQASFVAGVSDLPLPRRRPAPKAELAREET